MSVDKNLSICIAGGGASAALVLAHLAAHKKSKNLREIMVFDEFGRFAEGIAYGTKNPVHLLNVRAVNMSAFPDDHLHFFNWLKSQNYSYLETDFVPRMIYGEYLKDLWSGAVEKFQHEGCDIQLVREKYKKQSADVTIIATGNAQAFAAPGSEKLSVKDGYHADPWHIDYKSIKGNVVIIGTGLSMVDAVAALHVAGFKGHVTAISRNGLLPAPHVMPALYPCFFENNFSKTSYGLLHEIRQHVRKGEKKNIPWQAVMDSFRPETNKIWLALDEREQKKIKRFMTLWNIHRHRMAPGPECAIEDMKKTGALTIVKDRVESVAAGQVKGRKKTYKADHIINCLGYGHDKNFIFSPAMEKEGVFALGPALSGYYFETTAMPEIRVQAQRIASEILKS